MTDDDPLSQCSEKGDPPSVDAKTSPDSSADSGRTILDGTSNIQQASTAFTKQPWNLLERLGKLRDGLIIAATTLYILGYAVWSYSALINKTGPLPALDAQYFVAGIGPVASLLVGWWLSVHVLRAIGAKIVESLSDKPDFAIMAASIAGSTLGHISFLVLFVYVVIIYPNLPQEVGGARPRCGYVEADLDKLSAELRSEVFPTTGTRGDAKVIRSQMLQILYSGKDAIVVRLSPDLGLDNHKTYEIRSGAVEAVTGC